MKRDRVSLIAVVVFVAILALGLSITTYVVILPDLNRKDSTIRTAALAQCRRVQYLRTNLNRDHAAVRDALLLSASAIRTVPTKARLELADRLEATANRLLYLPPVDCRKAVDQPKTYHEPPALPLTP